MLPLPPSPIPTLQHSHRLTASNFGAPTSSKKAMQKQPTIHGRAVTSSFISQTGNESCMKHRPVPVFTNSIHSCDGEGAGVSSLVPTFSTEGHSHAREQLGRRELMPVAVPLTRPDNRGIGEKGSNRSRCGTSGSCIGRALTLTEEQEQRQWTAGSSAAGARLTMCRQVWEKKRLGISFMMNMGRTLRPIYMRPYT